MLLQLREVKKSFFQPDGSELPILDIPEFSLDAGDQVVMVGRSGCGKTTLLHVIAGISRPTSGRVKIDGWDIALMAESEVDQFRAERIGYVYQTFNLLPSFTAVENVLLGMTFGRVRADRERAKALLKRVGLEHRLTHKPPMLSVGEQQRVAVARALANRPQLILADEPTANVDVGNQQQVIDLLRQTCQEENVALILVTHAPEVAEQFPRVEYLEKINHVPGRKMSLWKIAWRSIQQRALASSLTALSMALGVALVVAVIVIHGVIDQSFRRGAQGYDLIVGAKGSPLELVLTAVYHLGRTPGNMSYEAYDELVNGQFAADIQTAVPICLGDNFKGFRVIGTTPDMFERLEYLDGRKYEFSEGRNFQDDAPMEAVIGAVAARRTGLKAGDKFKPVHGSAAERGEEHEPFDVVGILAPTGTPNDRAIFVNMEGFYHLHTKSPDEAAGALPGLKAKEKAQSHAADGKKEAKSGASDKAHAGGGNADKHKDDPSGKHRHDEAIPDELKEITAVLVVVNPKNPMRQVALPKLIGKQLDVQAVAPTEQISRLLEGIVGNVQLILLILAVMIVIVAGIGIMVSIYNSMSDRRHEIAIIRALGARRTTIMVVVLLESILLALGGGAAGLLLGHGLTGVLAPLIADQTGVSVNPLQFQFSELILIPGLIILAAAVGYLPAVVAYRTDVAQSLISSP